MRLRDHVAKCVPPQPHTVWKPRDLEKPGAFFDTIDEHGVNKAVRRYSKPQ